LFIEHALTEVLLADDAFRAQLTSAKSSPPVDDGREPELLEGLEYDPGSCDGREYYWNGSYIYQSDWTKEQLRSIAAHMEWTQRPRAELVKPCAPVPEVTRDMALAACRQWFHQAHNPNAEFSERQLTEAMFMVQAALSSQHNQQVEADKGKA
jgi:hypothetical protein